MNDKTLTVTVVGRRCVYINDYRVAGSKPYVSENLPSWSFEADINDLRYAIGRRPSSANKALKSRIEALEAELAKAKVPQWFYHPDYTEVCEFSPWDVIDGRYDPEPGNHVFEIECARPLPSIWCAVRVTADPDADERFTFTEHSSEAEAHKALEGSGNG